MGQTDFSDTIWNPEHLWQEGQIQRSRDTCVTSERCPDHSPESHPQLPSGVFQKMRLYCNH